MKKTWTFFKLRMKQLKSDKTGLFFAYVFPVLLLLGIGYPLQMMGNNKIKLAYAQIDESVETRAVVAGLSKQPMIALTRFDGSLEAANRAVARNEIAHFAVIRGATAGQATTGQDVRIDLHSNSLAENEVGALALAGLLQDARGGEKIALSRHRIAVSAQASYLAVLLPGIIGMTLLIIGLGGFGAVLIEEEHQGLFKNLKTIDISPMSFISGLFFSRMLVAYTVAAALVAISVLVFGISSDINIPLLLLVVTLGSATFLGLGLMISSFSKSVIAFNGIVNFVQLPLVILGGVFFSIAGFPLWLRRIAELLPLTEFNSAVRDLIFGSVGFNNVSELYPELAVLGVWAVVTLLLAGWKFRW